MYNLAKEIYIHKSFASLRFGILLFYGLTTFLWSEGEVFVPSSVFSDYLSYVNSIYLSKGWSQHFDVRPLSLVKLTF